MDIGTGCALRSACLGHDAMAGRFENCNELSAFVRDLLLIDVQNNYHLREEDNILRCYGSKFLNNFEQILIFC